MILNMVDSERPDRKWRRANMSQLASDSSWRIGSEAARAVDSSIRVTGADKAWGRIWPTWKGLENLHQNMIRPCRNCSLVKYFDFGFFPWSLGYKTSWMPLKAVCNFLNFSTFQRWHFPIFLQLPSLVVRNRQLQNICRPPSSACWTLWKKGIISTIFGMRSCG